MYSCRALLMYITASVTIICLTFWILLSDTIDYCTENSVLPYYSVCRSAYTSLCLSIRLSVLPSPSVCTKPEYVIIGIIFTSETVHGYPRCLYINISETVVSRNEELVDLEAFYWSFYVCFTALTLLGGNPVVVETMIKEHEQHVQEIFDNIEEVAKKLKVSVDTYMMWSKLLGCFF